MHNATLNDAHLSSFRPFDALEGFSQLCIEKKEHKQPQVRPLLCDDKINELNEKLLCLKNNDYVDISYWHNKIIHSMGYVTKINIPQGGFKIDNSRVEFRDILSLTIIKS